MQVGSLYHFYDGLWYDPANPRPTVWEADSVNLNINVLISTPEERPPLFKGHFSDAKGVTSHEGFHYV